MKTIASVLVAAVLTVTMVRTARADNYTGCYAGGHTGYGHGSTTLSDSSPINISGQYAGGLIDNAQTQQPDSMDQVGMLLGGQVGCDYEFHKAVFGLSYSLDGSDINGTAAGNHQYNFYGSGLESIKTDTLMDLSLRAGYDWDPLLTYVKAGFARAHDKFVVSSGFEDGVFFNGEKTLTGMVLGIGGEWPISKSVTAYAEADHYSFPGSAVHMVSQSTSGYGEEQADVNVVSEINVVKIGLNYRWSFAKN
jgi:outer membrane immunogenic protein